MNTRWLCGSVVVAALACRYSAPAGDAAVDASVGDVVQDVGQDSSAAPRVMQLAAGGSHTCVRLSDGTVRCWGINVHGELGDGTTTNRMIPTLVSALRDATDVSVGGGCGDLNGTLHCFGHTCARTMDHGVLCWGENFFGQLGDGTTIDRQTPTAVSGSINAVELALGATGTCARLDDSSLYCWGASPPEAPFGLVGGMLTPQFGANVASSPAPVAIGSIVQVARGAYHVCTVTVRDDVKCWGSNDYGQLGDGTTIRRDASVAPILTGAVQVAVGTVHSCARMTDGTVQCWGQSRLYDDAGAAVRNTPHPVAGLSGIVELVAQNQQTCARSQDGFVWCWGDNTWGELGDGTMLARSAPTRVPNLATVASIAMGTRHTCALLQDSSVWCWGDNSYGQLGDGTLERRTAPVRVVGL